MPAASPNHSQRQIIASATPKRVHVQQHRPAVSIHDVLCCDSHRCAPQCELQALYPHICSGVADAVCDAGHTRSCLEHCCCCLIINVDDCSLLGTVLQLLEVFTQRLETLLCDADTSRCNTNSQLSYLGRQCHGMHRRLQTSNKVAGHWCGNIELPLEERW
jgi:hypothetical protein